MARNTQTMATLMFLNLMLIFYYLEIQFDRDRPRVREKVTREMETEKGEMLERLTGRSKQVKRTKRLGVTLA